MVDGSFEPLLGAHNALVVNLLSTAGLEAMAPNDDGSDRCPLCFVIDRCQCGEGEACPFRSWIVRAADDQLTEARRLGLVSNTVQ
jgi:hypothetical protein